MLLENHPEVELLAHRTGCSWCFEGPPHCFPQQIHHLHPHDERTAPGFLTSRPARLVPSSPLPAGLTGVLTALGKGEPCPLGHWIIKIGSRHWRP